jgi:hypothetical protein
VTVIHRPQGVEEEAGGKREPGGVQGDHQEEGQEEEEVPGEEDRLVGRVSSSCSTSGTHRVNLV